MCMKEFQDTIQGNQNCFYKKISSTSRKPLCTQRALQGHQSHSQSKWNKMQQKSWLTGSDTQQNPWVTCVCFDCYFQSVLTFVPTLAFLFLILNSPLFAWQLQRIFLRVLLVIMQTWMRKVKRVGIFFYRYIFSFCWDIQTESKHSTDQNLHSGCF